jgi:hypothetical protein
MHIPCLTHCQPFIAIFNMGISPDRIIITPGEVYYQVIVQNVVVSPSLRVEIFESKEDLQRSISAASSENTHFLTLEVKRLASGVKIMARRVLAGRVQAQLTRHAMQQRPARGIERRGEERDCREK